jgi:hypothetical protein
VLVYAFSNASFDCRFALLYPGGGESTSPATYPCIVIRID